MGYYIVTEKQTFTIQQKLSNMKFTAIFIGAMMVMLLAHTSFAEFSEGQIETDEQAQDNPAAEMEVRGKCDFLCRISRREEEMEVKKRCSGKLCRVTRGEEEMEVKKRCNTMLCRIQRGEEIIVHKKRCSAFKCRITRGAEEIEVKKKNCNGNWCRISR